MKRLGKELSIVIAAVTLIVSWITFFRLVILPLFEDDFGFKNEIGFIFFTMIVTPLWEELLYRYVPFEICKKVNRSTKQDFTWITVILTSLLFALIHDSNGILAIVFQGVGGFILAMTYLVSKYPYWSCVLVHALWNVSIFYIVPKIF